MIYGTAANRIYFATLQGYDNNKESLYFHFGEVLRESWGKHNKRRKEKRAQAVFEYLQKRLWLSEPINISENVKVADVTKPIGFDNIKNTEEFLKTLCREVDSVRVKKNNNHSNALHSKVNYQYKKHNLQNNIKRDKNEIRFN
jgi:LPS O-antigen subunit length determinant protein (WzzB/FepE family)